MNVFFKKIRKNIVPLLLIAFIVSIPLMTDYVLMGSATASSLAHIETAYSGLFKHVPLRIGTMGSNPYGYGMSAFQADVFYILPALCRLVGADLGNAFKLTEFIFNILTVMVAFLCFEKLWGDEKLGLINTMFYVWCPYRISSLYTAGNLSEVFAWTFVPIVCLGIWMLYNDTPESQNAWIILTWGYSLIIVSSTVFMTIAAGVSVIVFIVMWKNTVKKKVVSQIIKCALCVGLVNAWFIVPMLLRMRKADAVAPMILSDYGSYGMYLAQYLKVFNFAGKNSHVWENGMKSGFPFEPGAAVVILIIILLWILFTAEKTDVKSISKRNMSIGKATVVAGIISIILSTNMFPWDLFQNKSMICSIGLALMEMPSRWGIAADVCLIMIAVYTIVLCGERYGEKVRLYVMLASTTVSFVTTQFLLNNILRTQAFAWNEAVNEFGKTGLPLITNESIIWRMSELISVFTICCIGVLRVVRRRKR